jgi:GH24 family phage-related lysozyme (muramidase)
LKGRGQPLPEALRQFFEPRFGCDFGDVRIHNNSRASATADQLSAQAFTVGRDIVLGAGQDHLESFAGRLLLAHELTHTVQQTGGERPAALSDHSVFGLSREISRAPVFVGRRVECDQSGNCQSVPGGEKSEPGKTENPDDQKKDSVAFPPGHSERMAHLQTLKDDIEVYRASDCNFQKRLDALPKECSEESDEKEAAVLSGEILAVELYLIGRLTEEDGLIGEALQAIYDILPKQSGPGIPKVPDEMWTEVKKLEADRKKVEQGVRDLKVDVRVRASGKSQADESDLEVCEPPKGGGNHPKDVSEMLIKRLMGKVKGDPGEGYKDKPYIANKGESVCTIGYGHQIPDCPIVGANGETLTKEERINTDISKLKCACADSYKADDAEVQLRNDIAWAVKHVHSVVPVDLSQDEFDALVDITLHRGSIPPDLLKTIKLYWCTAAGKNFARKAYLKSALKAQNSNKIEPGFVERRKRRVWAAAPEVNCCSLDV